MPSIYLLIAILSEVIATTALKATDGFTRIGPSLISIVGYLISFYALSLTLRTINIGIVYALWSGVGIVLLAVLGYLIYGQKLDGPALLGIGLILAGVIVMNLFSEVGVR